MGWGILGRCLMPNAYTRTTTIALSEAERAELTSMARSRSLPAALTLRARIVLAFDGHDNANTDVAQTLEANRATVTKWRSRYMRDRIAGLYDELRPGRPRTVDDERVASFALCPVAGVSCSRLGLAPLLLEFLDFVPGVRSKLTSPTLSLSSAMRGVRLGLCHRRGGRHVLPGCLRGRRVQAPHFEEDQQAAQERGADQDRGGRGGGLCPGRRFRVMRLGGGPVRRTIDLGHDVLRLVLLGLKRRIPFPQLPSLDRTQRPDWTGHRLVATCSGAIGRHRMSHFGTASRLAD